MTADIVIPDFEFSGQYYPEILEDLIRFLRVNAPELSDEDDTEPHIQLLRAFALSAHLNNVLLDLVANESFLPTARLRSSHRNLLALIDYTLAQMSPASVDVLVQLTKTFAAAGFTTAPAKSQFSTLGSRSARSIVFEVTTAVTLAQRTDLVGKVYSFNETGDVWTDHTAEAQTPSGNFSPTWGTVEPGDALYIGHADVLWDQINVFIATAAAQITAGVWEYYDGNFNQDNPTSVTNLGDRLRFNINSILGTSNRAGSTVRVRSNITGAFKDLISTWDAGSGENRITTDPGSDPFLGQPSPSTSPDAYIIGADWREIPGLTDNTALLSAAPGERTVTYFVPQTLTANWSKVSVGTGALAFSAYWIRFRVVAVGGAPTAPAITEIQIHRSRQYQLLQATQGNTRDDNPLGSSDGTASQTFLLSGFPVIDDVNLKVFVDESGVEQEYTRVSNFLSSTSVDRHFTVAFDDDGIATITFGDGTSGKIPPAGVDNIRTTYRIMEDVDGNVGAGTVTVNRSGIAFMSAITNPRPASGYKAREGSTDADLARVKVAGPAALRVLGRAVSPPDIETLALAFKAADGSKPIARTLVLEESFGPKTMEVVVVGAGGATIIATLLDELELYFNGSATVKGVLLMNNEVTATNFTPKTINVTATVEGGSLSAIQTALTALLNPLAQHDDGTYQWGFGTEVPLSKLIQAIMNSDPPPRDCAITTPAADVALATRELPVVGTLTITVVP